MSASTSSSPSTPAVLPKPDTATPHKRNFAFARPLLSCGGALLVGAVLVRLLPQSTTATAQSTPTITDSAPTPMLLSASQLVEARLAPPSGMSGRSMRGHWKLTTDVTGKAAAAGAIARWAVEPGTQVKAGDSVVEISSGSASRPAPRAESQQDQAEKEQVAAANGQSALAQRLSMAQNQLVASQERVENAQKKVANARSLVKRLLAGEKIPVPGGATKKATPTMRENSESLRLDRETRRAEDAASDARDRVAKSKSELDDAKQSLSKAQKQSDAATTALTKAEADFKAEKTTADVLQSARADMDDAQATLKSAQTRADVAQRAYSSSQDKAMLAEKAVSESRIAAQKAETPRPDAEASASVSDDSGRYMTADQAATLVADALRESKAAARQADRIHTRVDDYQRQVKLTSQRVESASQGLQKAQQEVLDSVPRPRFTATVAPVSGTVTWISRLAREVGPGQTVFGISQGKNGFLRFEDSTDTWKALRVGQTLQAASAPPASEVNGETSNASATDSPAMPASAARIQSETPLLPSTQPSTFSVRITRISPPTSEGEAAQIDAVRTDGTIATEMGANEVQAQIPLDALPATAPKVLSTTNVKPRPVVVPLSVILPRDGASYVAVVTPSKQDAQTTILEWRPIQIEHQTAFDVEVKSGLQAGERLVTQPVLLLSDLKPEEKQGMPVIVEASG